MLYYKILPKCDPSSALTYNPGDENNRALLKKDSSLDTQLWTLLEVIAGTDHGFALLNKSSNMVLAAPEGYKKDCGPRMAIAGATWCKRRAANSINGHGAVNRSVL